MGDVCIVYQLIEPIFRLESEKQKWCAENEELKIMLSTTEKVFYRKLKIFPVWLRNGLISAGQVLSYTKKSSCNRHFFYEYID